MADNNRDNRDNRNNKNKKPLIFYYFMIILVVLILNAFFFPRVMSGGIQEIGYDEFLDMIDEGKVESVEVTDKEILITGKAKSDGEEAPQYNTGIIGPFDEELIDKMRSENISFSRTIPKENSFLVNFLLTWVLPILLMVGLSRFLMNSMQRQMTGAKGSSPFGNSGAKEYQDDGEGKTFDDVAGQDEAKDALYEIVDFLHNPKKYAEIGAVMPKGVLLVGPPGTGKTLIAKAVAGEADVPFFSISGSEFVEMFVGLGARKVRELFKEAQEKAPCIIFIDEIDTIGKKRGQGGLGGNDEREQTLNQLLAEMDGFDGTDGVVILAATNRPDSLDPALLRPGRFDRRVPVELPDLAGREAILKVHAKKVKRDPDIDYNHIALTTAGASGADLANMINEAALRAVKDNRNRVLQEDIEESVEVVIAGQQRKNAVISTKEKRIIAYHEVGHALVAAIQTDSDPVHKITIIPRTSGALGYTMQVPEEETVLMTKDEAYNKIVTLTGGRAAEEIVFGEITSGASNDIEQATKIARAMVTKFGMSDKFDMMALETDQNQYLGGDSTFMASQKTAYEVDKEVLNIIKSAHEDAKNILLDNREKLTEISNYLLEMETITGEEFMKILKNDPEDYLNDEDVEVEEIED